jgi:hypothetical protein
MVLLRFTQRGQHRQFLQCLAYRLILGGATVCRIWLLPLAAAVLLLLPSVSLLLFLLPLLLLLLLFSSAAAAAPPVAVAAVPVAVVAVPAGVRSQVFPAEPVREWNIARASHSMPPTSGQQGARDVTSLSHLSLLITPLTLDHSLTPPTLTLTLSSQSL